jgi:DNA-binding transcriptional LysR family regulator
MSKYEFTDFTLDQLTMLVAVAEQGSYASASEALGRSASTVNTAIANLEDGLGIDLFQREGRRSILTDAGKRILEEARLALAQAQIIRGCAASLQSGTEASLSIVVDTLFPRQALVFALGELHRQFPHVAVRVREEIHGDSLALVQRGEVDVGFLPLEEVTGDVIARPLRPMQLVHVCAAGHQLAKLPQPMSEEAVRDALQIVLSQRYHPGSEDRGVFSMRTWRVVDLELKLRLIESGIGWGSAPLDRVEQQIAAGTLVRLSLVPMPEGTALQLFSLVRVGRPLGPAGQFLVERLEVCATRPTAR